MNACEGKGLMNSTSEPTAGAPDGQQCLADWAAVVDMLHPFAGALRENQVVDAMRDFFTRICSPKLFTYLPVVEGLPERPQPPANSQNPHTPLQQFLSNSDATQAWTESGHGFRLRIRHGDETLGVMEVEDVAFPQHKEHYLNLALASQSVWGLAIHNARLHERLRSTLAEREKAEQEMARLNAALKRRIAQAEDANKELEAFSYSVSHDLRAPLHGIEGWSHILLEDCGDSLGTQGRGYLNTIRAETAHMAELLNALLQLSRINQSAMHPEQLDLSAMAYEVTQELQATEPDRQVDVNIAPHMTAQGDPMLLRMVLRHVLGNAWKFTPKSTPARIEFGCRQEADKLVYFVRDNGAGFDMSQAA